MKPKIKEIIVVEGKDDIAAVKQAVDAHVIAVHGYSSFKKKTIEKLKQISLTNDIIILTDPDFAGKKIRNLIKVHIPDAKHAFISRKEGTKNNNSGFVFSQLIHFSLNENRDEIKDWINIHSLG